MNIDRFKLNTLLRTGLNPEIKTRKQLAAYLDLDPTSLTRWFASRDRLGNPRYPVVPDRHVTKILKLFKLDPHCLSLSDEEFRRHCLEIALLRAIDDGDGLHQKAMSRAEKIALRKLTIPQYSPKKFRNLSLSLVAASVLFAVVWQLFIKSDHDQTPSSLSDTASNEMDCWTGYSESLGTLDKTYKSDPCNYGQLLQNVLAQLKASNESRQLSKSTAAGDYMFFLSNALDQQRTREKITLNFELGRNELNRLNYPAALQYFKTTGELLATSPDPSPKVIADLSAYTAIAVYSDKPWRYARQSYEQLLLADPIWKNHWPDTTELAQNGRRWRNLALSELENGNLTLAKSHVEAALRDDSSNFGEQHLSIASNWLVLSRILSLQDKPESARDYAQRAIALDINIFGEHHPRVAQDRIVLTLLTLRVGNITEAHRIYQLVSNFFQEIMAVGHPGSDLEHWLPLGLDQLQDAELLQDEEARMLLRKEGWSSLNKAFTHSNPFIPRRYAVLVLQEAMRLQLL